MPGKSLSGRSDGEGNIIEAIRENEGWKREGEKLEESRKKKREIER